jgi:hypothetical protein
MQMFISEKLFEESGAAPKVRVKDRRRMTKPLELSDFRAIRIILEPDDFAVSDGQPDIATDLIDQETWQAIVGLPEDVSIRTSNHQGTILKALSNLNFSWVSHAIGDEQDVLYEVLLYTIDEMDAMLFNVLHGYYRQAIGCLRNILELTAFGALCQLRQDRPRFERWRRGEEIHFGEVCTQLQGLPPIQALNAALLAQVNDTFLERRQGPHTGGWARRLYATLCASSHSRPSATNVGLWASNGPVYVPAAFDLAATLCSETLALCYILIKLARPQLVLPDAMQSEFETFQGERPVAYHAWTQLFSAPPADQPA